jgi:voltage-gated potassium channel
MAERERKKFTSRATPGKIVPEPWVAMRRVRGAFLALVIIATTAVLGYMIFEGWSFLDALYMTVITLTTVGYREVRELDTSGQLWTMALLITGVGTLFYAAVSFVELVVEGAVRGYFGRRRMEAAINRLSEHYIVCGYGRVGRQVVREFAADGVPFVVVDQNPQKVEECLEKGYPAILGEASEDATLEEAGIQRARGLVATVNSDADNVFVVLSARKINPGLLRGIGLQAGDSRRGPHPLSLRCRWPQARLACHPSPDRGLPRHRHSW